MSLVSPEHFHSTGAVAPVCAQTPVNGQACWTRFAMDGQDAGTFSHKVAHSLCQKLGTVDQFFSTTRNITDNTVSQETNVRIANLDCFRTHLSLEIYKIQNQFQAECVCVLGSQTAVSQSKSRLQTSAFHVHHSPKMCNLSVLFQSVHFTSSNVTTSFLTTIITPLEVCFP